MAHHKSAIKRIRQNSKKRLENRYYGKTTRNAIRKLEALTSKEEATTALPSILAMVDKLAKRNQIHQNKAANMKSAITKRVNAL
ncbi:MAG TPA: 30S ribosomal protein S20 [Chitinophagales bacterium]|nr:30S ribosomal protein S20 [Chitinophagales bacterium]